MRDIRTLDFNLLKAFEALLDEESVTRASQRLSVTQPAMSAMLSRLRESFDDPLFVRVQHGIKPTNRAIELGKDVKLVLAQIHKMLEPPHFDPATAHMKLTIASTDYGFEAVVMPFLGRLKQVAPHISVALLPIQDNTILTWLEQGKIDLAVMNPERVRSEDMHVKPLYDEEYVCTMRQSHPMANKPLDLEVFCGLDFVMMSYDGGGFRGATDEALAKLGRSRTVSLSVSNFLLIPKILAQSDMVAMLPSRLAWHQAELVSCPPPLPIEGFAMAMVWHERTHHDRGHRWVRGLLQETY